MNLADKKEFELIFSKIDIISNNLSTMRVDAEAQHEMLRQDIKFVKENLFNPHEGLWAETKLNSQFRVSTSKWRGVIGTGFVGLFFKQIWDLFKVG